MDLPLLWFVIVTVFWTGFFLLEGFDFGVGALHRVVARGETERRVAINAIGPLWDGNEVWLIVAGASMFAAFPLWYATWFSALYLAMLLVLVALIIRGVSFEFRGKSEHPRWRATWSGTLTIGSVLAPLLIGIGLGDLLVGLPIDGAGEFTGTFWDLLTPYGLLVGLTLLVLCLLHGATFLSLKTDGQVRARAYAIAAQLRWVALALVVAFAAWTTTLADRTTISVLLLAVALGGALATVVTTQRRREGWSFLSTAATIGASVASLFASLYPYVMVSSTDSSFSITAADAASSTYALTVMTWVALVLMPIVLAYQGWSAYVFRRRVAAPPQQGAATATGQA